MEGQGKPWAGFVISGLASGAGYALLFAYLNDKDVMAVFMQKDKWYLPVLTAFAFSIAHGAFTGYFWDVLGVKAKPAAKKG
jgi:hypothetical protein